MTKGKAENLQEDFAWCEAVIRRHSKSFYAAFSRLPPPKRQGVYAVYAFCREADDSVDRYASEERLAAMGRGLDALVEGRPPDAPLWRALHAVFQSYGLRAGPFYDMLAGQRQDLFFTQPQTLEELEDYAYHVAGSVGLMLLPLLSGQAGRLQVPAVSLGVAMQLTNILRDVGEDLDAGRVYLPRDLMDAFGYTRQRLEARVADRDFICLWETLACRAEALYTEMEHAIGLLDEDSRLPTLSALYLYRGILDEVRRGGYQCFHHRGVVPPATRRLLAAQAADSLAGNAAGYA